jgi:hypothetical protein
MVQVSKRPGSGSTTTSTPRPNSKSICRSWAVGRRSLPSAVMPAAAAISRSPADTALARATAKGGRVRSGWAFSMRQPAYTLPPRVVTTAPAPSRE